MEELDMMQIVKNMLAAIGENPDREGLAGTPERVVRMWKEIFRGYDIKQKPKVTVFKNGADGIQYDEMIIDTGYYFSFCEHHMVPFFGQYYFGYIPSRKVLGLSKVSRIVDFFSSKLQVQERLVREITNELESALSETDNDMRIAPQAIGLVMKGRHLCKEMRGVKKIHGVMTTSDLRGKFRTEPETRAEFLHFINSNGNH